MIPDEGMLDAATKLEIQQLAEGLTKDEVCQYLWGVTFTELEPPLAREFTIQYTRGRTQFKVHAVNALKSQMHGKNGLQASLAALIRFADAWQPITDASATGNGVFNFKINLKGDEDEL